MALLWPVAAGAGFLAMVALVIALGLGSTNRYERTRRAGCNSAAGAPSSSSGARANGQPAETIPIPAVPAAAAPAAAGGPAERPHGGPAVASGPRPVSGWWLLSVSATGESAFLPVGQAGGDATGPLAWPATALATARVLAGPFPDRLDAETAALTRCVGAVGPMRPPEVAVVHGVRRPDGTLTRRPEPAELAWLAELGGLLEKLPAAWDAVVSDTDPRTTLVVELAAALFEAGLPIHDCDSRTLDGTATDDRAASGGGVCLTPHPAGVLVSWAASDRLSLHTARGVAVEVAVRGTMAAAVVDLLAACGFPVQMQPASSAVVVPVLER